MTKLFIIGNGFDSAHRLKTSYENFKGYLTSNCSGINLEQLIVPEAISEADGGITYDENEVISMLFYLLNQAERNTEQWQAKIKSGKKKWFDEVEWGEVETSLGRLDFDEVFEWYDDILDDDGDIDLFKTANRNSDRASQLTIPTLTIQSLFTAWINTINLDSAKPKEEFQKLVNNQDYFLTFNYTETLEKLYEIKEDNICHIHGKQNTEIFFGHGNLNDYTEYYMQNHIGSEDSLNNINDQLRKKTDIALENNQEFFDNLEEVDIKEVYSYGFSFSEVDEIYLEEICNRTNTENVIWYFNDYDADKHYKYKQVLKGCGYKGSFDTFNISK